MTLDQFWSGRTTFSYQNWSGRTIFSWPILVWSDHFFIQNRSGQTVFIQTIFSVTNQQCNCSTAKVRDAYQLQVGSKYESWGLSQKDY